MTQVSHEKWKFLNGVDSPADVKKLKVGELRTLADEIRRFILNSVSKTGGHLASNLGVVELTLAMHYVFDFKEDKLLWDVGHQCYVHKIITGRKEAFERLRLPGGISGFPNPAESVYNDNSMAIDATVGAMAKYFSRVRLSQTYEDLRRTTRNILEHMPVIGKSVEEAIEKIKKSIRMVLPASQMFESLDIPYFGPVDGHDVGSLIRLFKALAELEHPAILHVFTRKGKGFSPPGSRHSPIRSSGLTTAERKKAMTGPIYPASDGASKFHSTGPFKINGDTVESTSVPGRRSFTNVFGEHLTKLAEKDSRIVTITSAMCDGTGLVEFRKRFADRFYDVGIAESAAVDIAAGLAGSGLKPVVCIYSTFLQRSFDQIFQEVALQNLPVVFCIDRAGVVGSDGPTHHGLMDIGFLRMLPNMVLTAPANEVEMKLALEFALGQDGPVVIRYPKDLIPSQDFVPAYVCRACAKPFRLGKSVVVKKRKDSAVAIVSYGSVLTEALEAARLLAKEGIAVDVINARFAAPVDKKIVSLLEKGKGLITVEDHTSACGFGSAVLELAASQYPIRNAKYAIRVLGAPRRFIKHDSRSAQLMEVGVNADKIVKTAKEMLKT